MGVEYRHYLIPEDNTFKPGPEALSRLVGALHEGGFVSESCTDALERMTLGAPDEDEELRCLVYIESGGRAPFPCPCSPRDIAELGGQDFKLIWSVESSNESGLKYPLIPFPEWGDAYYELELHMARDFVYTMSEVIDPFDEVACGCGQSLEYYPEHEDEVFDIWNRRPFHWEGRIHRICPSCGTPFRPQRLVGRIRDGRTGHVEERAGGATYLFAVVIDCGKGFAREGWPIRASEEFRLAVTRALGQGFYEVGDIY